MMNFSSSSRCALQRLIEISNDVVDVLDAHAKPNHLWRYTHLLEVDGESAVLSSVATGEREELPRREILVRLVAVMLDDSHLSEAGAQP